MIESKLVEYTKAMVEEAYKTSGKRRTKHELLFDITDNLYMMVKSQKEIIKNSVRDDNPWKKAILKSIATSR